MAINSIGQNAALDNPVAQQKVIKDKSVLGKDDFLKLLLVELKYQDPTAPTDTEKILSQTSQLASLEASSNTNKALEDLAASLSSTNQFSTISAIGKTADLGSDAIVHEEGTVSEFEIYFPNSIQEGTIEITDTGGSVVKTLDVGTNPTGVYKFTWDGSDLSGNAVKSDVYKVTASYSDQDGNAQTTRIGAYPIESVRFENGETLVKVGSSYVPLAEVREVY
ncbi:MAG: flagellar hook capping protein [Sulfurimonas sp.]|nr:MAG: flagellar hook capping protein [Sulfurimonas sp.]